MHTYKYIFKKAKFTSVGKKNPGSRAHFNTCFIFLSGIRRQLIKLQFLGVQKFTLGGIQMKTKQRLSQVFK